MRKKLNLLLGLVFIISMAALTGCGGSGKAGEKNPYEGKWVAVSAQMMGISVSVDETFGGDFCKGWNGCNGSGTLSDRGGKCSHR